MVMLLKLYFVPLLDLGKKQKCIEMDPRWQVLHRQLIESRRGPAARARRSGRRFANLARWVRAVFAKQVGGHFLVEDYLVLRKNFVFEGYH